MDFVSSIFSFIRDSSSIQTLLLFLAVLVLTYAFTTYKTVNIPGPVALPFIGNSLNLLFVKRRDRHLYFRDLHKQYGDIYRFYFGQKLVIFLNNYELINEALVKKSDIFTDRPDFLSQSGTGVIWTNGTSWKTLRRFTLHTLRDFGLGKKSLEEVIQQEVNGLLEQFEQQKGHGFKLKPIFTVAVSNVISSVVFGCRHNYNEEYYKDVLYCFDYLVKNQGPLGISLFYPVLKYFQLPPPWHYAYKIRDYIRKQIAEHETTYNSDNIRDFVDLYIKQEREGTMDKDIFTKSNLFKVIFELFGAGTETTATTLEWAILYMIEYPEIQEKCREEILKIVGDSRMVVLADKKELHYLNATLCEVQRISSIAPLGLPHMTSEDCILSGYHIPKKSVIIAHQAAAHMDSRVWSQPDKFKPERFLDENNKLCKSEKLIPFSTGPRICMGETMARIELFMFFSNILQRFELVRNNEEDILNFNGQYGVTKSTFSHNIKVLIR